MRIARFSVLALTFACSSSPDTPSDGTGGAGGLPASGGASSAGSPGQPTAGTPSGGSPSTGGATPGGGAGGAHAGSGGASSGGASGSSTAGSGTSGASTGGSAGAAGASTGGSGGGGACVKNLACKLDPPPTTGDLKQDCVDRINQFLTKCACLPALTRRTDGEACADQMAKYDADHNEAHAGIRANICQPGGSQNSCPGYSSNNQVVGLCMQQMWDEGPPPTADCTGECYETHGHFINMTDDSVTKVACGFYTTSGGKVWAVQNFSR